MNWINLQSTIDLQNLIQQSYEKPQIIFKHSTTCPISSISKTRLEGGSDVLEQDVDIHYLDLHQFRSLSDMVSKEFEVEHQSPQVLVIHQGKSIYNTSHLDISANKISEVLTEVNS